jgi:hypothetical protein
MTCSHEYCKECFAHNIEYLLSENLLSTIEKCPDSDCNQPLNKFELHYLLSKNFKERIAIFKQQAINSRVITCPKCQHQFESEFQEKLICMNKDCGCFICGHCKDVFHEMSNCKEVFLKERVKDMLEINDPYGISQCPRCRLPYFKDPKSDHVKCQNSECGVEFCFGCACLRSPTMEHGNHYHRPKCKHFFEYDGNDDVSAAY